MRVNPILRFRASLIAAAAVLFGQPGQAVAQLASGSAYSHDADAPVAHAVRIHEPITMDGRLDEAVWMTASPITDFRQLVPYEGEPVSEKTEVRFLYDDDSIYVGAWLWDRGEILTRLARRDVGVPDADFFVVLFDSYHDHRTAYRFATSPSAMKRDEIVTGGGSSGGGGAGFGDTSWDPVWEVRTSITDEGWFVEMRIPFSQLRYSSEDVQTWGLQVERKIRRHGEDTLWSFTPRRERGGVPRFGHLHGIRGIPQGKRLEMLPYVGGRAEFTTPVRPAGAVVDNPFRSGSDYFTNAGIDLKYRLTSNVTLDATLNPDFGQVEMDPAVINLSAFETRFDEKRPFFVEGGEIFRFGEEGGGRDAQLIYSRRIGRTPQGSLPSAAVYTDVPQAAMILGAAKLTGKSPTGWSIGVVNAVTGKESATWTDGNGIREVSVVEPLSNYFAGRVRRDVRNGAGAFGVIGTAVNRRLDEPLLDGRLRASAYAAGVDGRVEWDNRAWTATAALASSHVQGSTQAIDLTQRSSARYFQRPDATHLTYDPTATSLQGAFGRASLNKGAGEWRGGVTFTAITPSYEINDLGFQSNADRLDLSTDFGYNQSAPGRHFRRWDLNVSPDAVWNFAGQVQASEISVNGGGQLLSFHTFGGRFARQFRAHDDRLTRGGPSARAPAGYSGRANFNTDSRGSFNVRTNVGFSGDEAGGWSRNASVNLGIRFREIYDISFGPELLRSYTAAQYVTALTDPVATHTLGRRYVFAGIDQTTVSLSTRFNATFTPDLSLELYAQPFLSSGDYGPLKELAAPGTFDFLEYGTDLGTISRAADGRFVIDPDGDGPAQEFRVSDGSFNYHSLLGNAVLRWEWRPGSTLFLVWQQSRADRLTHGGDTELRRIGAFNLERDTRALFGIKPSNILLIKMNYWFNP